MRAAPQAGRECKTCITKSIIDAIPLDKGDYRPDGISKSALELAWHMASA
jgi:hypothetical protein